MTNKLSRYFNVELNQYSIWLAKITSAILLIMLILKSLQLGLGIEHATANIDIPLTSTSKSTHQELAHYHYDLITVINQELFGRYESADENGLQLISANGELPDDQILLTAPLAKINAKLVGVVTSKNPKQSIAIIEQSNQQISYAVGEALNNSKAEIVRIFKDRIILNEQGQYVALMLN